jgi:hypothetical protein
VRSDSEPPACGLGPAHGAEGLQRAHQHQLDLVVRFTVFREIPSTRAISEIGTPSARRSRRTSAQSSTPNTRFLPGSTPARVSGKLVNFQLPRPGQYWPAVDTPSTPTDDIALLVIRRLAETV